MDKFPEKPMGLDEELFQLLFDSAEIANFTPEEKEKYDLDMRTERDFQNQLDYAREEGLREGHENGLREGLKEGREVERREIVERLLAKGMSQGEVEAILSSV